jgi:hypothetical protein
MEKQIRDFEINAIILEWTYEVEISKMKEDIAKLEALGATHIKIGAYEEYGSNYVSIDAISRREETDEEMDKRIKEQQSYLDQIKRRDLDELERLKKKYQI